MDDAECQNRASAVRDDIDILRPISQLACILDRVGIVGPSAVAGVLAYATSSSANSACAM